MKFLLVSTLGRGASVTRGKTSVWSQWLGGANVAGERGVQPVEKWDHGAHEIEQVAGGR